MLCLAHLKYLHVAADIAEEFVLPFAHIAGVPFVGVVSLPGNYQDNHLY